MKKGSDTRDMKVTAVCFQWTNIKNSDCDAFFFTDQKHNLNNNNIHKQ